MDNEEAKFILRAYRQSGADAGNEAFAEALEQAKRDPELGRWLERELALDKVVVAKVRAVTPPAGLRDAILAGGKMSVRPQQKTWWRQPQWMALAASVALIAGTWLGWSRFAGGREARSFGEFAMNDVMKAANHDAHGPGMGQLAAIVSDPARKLSAALPIEFDALKDNGCRTVRFAGHDVLEVCFMRGGKLFHFYAMKRPDKSRIDVGVEGLRFADTKDGASSAVWSDGQHVYALVGVGSGDMLRAFL
ncbi:MAG: DUF3379 family protein [Nibricoccus sp.]